VGKISWKLLYYSRMNTNMHGLWGGRGPYLSWENFAVQLIWHGPISSCSELAAIHFTEGKIEVQTEETLPWPGSHSEQLLGSLHKSGLPLLYPRKEESKSGELAEHGGDFCFKLNVIFLPWIYSWGRDCFSLVLNFWDWVSLCSPGLPWTHGPPGSASQILGL
jgi:hypothetical protein